MNDSERATFGRGGEDVLDEGYRRAKKLDRWQFATNFHPAEYGILDEVSQILLPTVMAGMDPVMAKSLTSWSSGLRLMA